MNILIFVGAGASAELGVPMMRPMAEEFLQHLKDLSWPSKDYHIVEQALESNDHDMEHLIDRIDRLRNGLDEQQHIGLPIDVQFLDQLQSISREAEWFVQHVCEKIQRILAEVVWAPVLKHVGNNHVTIVTSNYDRAIEIGARAAGVTLDDGFDSQPHVEIAAWRNYDDAAAVSLLKVHGSTDWYQTTTGAAIKLKHPIPLLGKFRLIECSGNNDSQTLSAALILPSREKQITTPPYPSIHATFHHRARTADAAIFVGTSLRDPHLCSVFTETAKRIPTAIVAPRVPTNLPSTAISIQQTGSYFLSSTLPRLLAAGSLFAARLGEEDKHVCTEKVVDLLVLAKDRTKPEQARCAAIEALLRVKYCMDGNEIKWFLNDSSSAVRRYGVGLIPTAIDSTGLVDFAAQVALESDDLELKEELQLLTEFMTESTNPIELQSRVKPLL